MREEKMSFLCNSQIVRCYYVVHRQDSLVVLVGVDEWDLCETSADSLSLKLK